MGDIIKISSQCGYTKDLNVGGGLASSNLNMVNHLFPEANRKAFSKYLKNKEVESFSIDYQISLCENCKEIYATPTLAINLVNGQRRKLESNCPKCAKKVKVITDSLLCPKCGQEMTRENIGQWD